MLNGVSPSLAACQCDLSYSGPAGSEGRGICWVGQLLSPRGDALSCIELYTVSARASLGGPMSGEGDPGLPGFGCLFPKSLLQETFSQAENW